MPLLAIIGQTADVNSRPDWTFRHQASSLQATCRPWTFGSAWPLTLLVWVWTFRNLYEWFRAFRSLPHRSRTLRPFSGTLPHYTWQFWTSRPARPETRRPFGANGRRRTFISWFVRPRTCPPWTWRSLSCATRSAFRTSVAGSRPWTTVFRRWWSRSWTWRS